MACPRCMYMLRQMSGTWSIFIRLRSIRLPSKACMQSRLMSNVTVEAVPPPKSDNCDKIYPEKIQRIVNDISNLSLIETSQLNELLKSTLNLSDVPVMAVGSTNPTAVQAADETKTEEPSCFTVKLVKYADDSKIKLIKEVKSLIEGMNLVQAKKFVESVPQVIQSDVNKEAALKLKTALEAVGGVVELE